MFSVSLSSVLCQCFLRLQLRIENDAWQTISPSTTNDMKCQKCFETFIAINWSDYIFYLHLYLSVIVNTNQHIASIGVKGKILNEEADLIKDMVSI